MTPHALPQGAEPRRRAAPAARPSRRKGRERGRKPALHSGGRGPGSAPPPAAPPAREEEGAGLTLGGGRIGSRSA